MGSESNRIPEEYVDMLVQEFAYDPIRLPLAEDPAQVLYNRRTLETIWDAEHDAVNPFTRQPFDISHAIPQSRLRQQMHQYILDNTSPTLTLEVIPDYTKPLSKYEMINLLNGLILYYRRLVNAHYRNGNVENERYWKVFWQRFNLVRLYCQYSQENRELFISIRGYAYLLEIVDERLLNLCNEYYTLCGDTKEVCKELAKIVDVIGFREGELRMLPEDFLCALVHIISDLIATGCDHLKIHSMVLRIYRQMFYDCNIDSNRIFCKCVVAISLFILERENFRDICNEDLYNGMIVLKSAWIRNRTICVTQLDFVDVIVNVANICISRFEDMHAATISRWSTTSLNEDDEKQKNVNLISIALDRGLWLINSLITGTPQEGEDEFFSHSNQKLNNSDIGGVIVRMLELVLAGFKHISSSHLQLAINIAAILYTEEEGSGRRNGVIQVLEDFLGSEIVDNYDTVVKILLQDIVYDVNVVEMDTTL